MKPRARSLLTALLVTLSMSVLLGGCLKRKLKPLNPCLVSGVVAEISVTNIDKIDMLFMVDNSGSMKEEQSALRDEMPRLIKVLASGDRTPNDGVPNTDFPPANNMHIGVVTSDMGLPGIPGITSCDGLGDDGVMVDAPRSADVTGCLAQYPRFLNYQVNVQTPDQTAQDFQCISAVGTDGCGFEQQLESALKAVWPSDDTQIQFLSEGKDPSMPFTFGHGDPGGINAGFLRNDPTQGISLIAIILVTDEEDCSSQTTVHFLRNEYLDLPNHPERAPLQTQGLNVRCNFNEQNLYPLERYINGFKALRPGAEQLVIFAGIVGVPADLTTIPEDFADNPSARDNFYGTILGDPRMQPVVDDQTTADPADDVMRPSCDTSIGRAYPPRRITQVAQGFGANGMIQSICKEGATPGTADFSGAIDAIIAIIARQLGAVCLPKALVRNAQGMVGCDVVWELPTPDKAQAGVPTDCAQLPFLLPVGADGEATSKSGGMRCRVAQLAVVDKQQVATMTDGIVFNDGWYYDDFSDAVMKECTTSPKQRVAFSSNAKPPTGVTVQLECLNETQSLADNRKGLQGTMQPKVGDPCKDVLVNGQMQSGNAACVVHLSNGMTDERLFCHGELNVCSLSCSTDADCPAAWVCDTRAPVQDSGGADHFQCVNPTCGT